MRIPFIGHAAIGRSKPVNAERLVNLFPEVDQSGKAVISLHGTPGLITKVTPQGGESRNALAYQSVLYTVIDNDFFSIDTNYVATNVGALNTSTGYVSMTTNGLTVLNVDGSDGWLYTISGASWAQVADGDFPANPVACDMIANTYVVLDGGTGNFYSSPDGSAWDPLDLATAEMNPDDLVTCIADHRELILFGVESSEIWAFQASGSDFPFQLISGALLETGIAGVAARCKGDNSVFFLGNDGVVWRLNGYTPVRVSTHLEENVISGLSTTADCRMWSEKRDGHTFVWMTFPTGDRTLVYDAANQRWHERSYMNQTTGDLHRHRANWYQKFNGKHVVGDFETGKIYELDASTYDDAGDYIPAIGAYRHLDAQGKQVFHHQLEIEVESGVGLNGSGQGIDPQIMLRWSDDGGRTFENELWEDIGGIGAYRTRARWGPLGCSEDRVYEFRITDPVKRTILNANLDVTVGR